MKREEFVAAYMEGVTSITDGHPALATLVGMVYDLRKEKSELKAQISEMDDWIREDGEFSPRCRCCNERWTPDCELSEFHRDGNYCGKNEFCTP